MAFGVASVLLCIVAIAVIAWASGSGLIRAAQAIREPLLLAMATRSSITCIPSAMTALTRDLGYDTTRVQLLLPLGITLFRFGPVLYYAFTTIFVSQLYGISISPVGYVLVLAGAILTGLASAGTTGVLTISLLGVIFQPLGLPLEAALALLVTVDPVIDIFRTASIVVPNLAAVAVIYRGDDHASHAGAPVPSAQARTAP
jgi:proton glutamate symport protein